MAWWAASLRSSTVDMAVVWMYVIKWEVTSEAVCTRGTKESQTQCHRNWLLYTHICTSLLSHPPRQYPEEKWTYHQPLPTQETKFSHYCPLLWSMALLLESAQSQGHRQPAMSFQHRYTLLIAWLIVWTQLLDKRRPRRSDCQSYWDVTISDLAIFNFFFFSLRYNVAYEVSPTWLTLVYLWFVQVAVTWLHLSLTDWTTSPLIDDSLLVRCCDSVLGVVRVLLYGST